MAWTGFSPIANTLHRVSTSSSLTGGVVALAFTLSACGPAKNVPKREKPVANTNTSQISATGPVVADGVATSTISIVIRDQNGEAMPGLQPVVNASGTGNTIQTCSVTDVSGASSCVMTSTVAEMKSINLSAPVAVAGASVEFVAGPAVKLGFSTQASNATAGQNFVRQPRVDVQDAQGNRVPSAVNSITLAIAAGSSGTLNGTKSVAASAGRASYTGLNITGIVSPAQVRLSATAAGLTAAISEAFTIVPDAGNTLAFDTQPAGGAAGVVWSPQPVVHILDSGGSLLTTGTAAVTLTLTAGGGSLLGTSTVSAVGGVATFSDLKMENVGAKQITATSPGSANIISNSFHIVPGAPTALAFSTQPGGGSANQVWPQQPVVRLFDAYGNLCVNSNATVALSLQTGTGVLAGTTSLAASSGVATYAGLKMSLTGQKSLRATAGTLFIDSNSFVIGSGTAAVLKFATQPGGGTAGIAWTQQPVVEVLDDQNNRVTGFNGTVGLSLTTGSGSLAASLAAVSGVATFTGLKMNVAGTGKILSAGITGLTGITSTAFAIAHNTPSQLVVRTQPSSNDLANTILSTQPALDLKDAYGNLITSGLDAGAPIVASLYSGGGAVLGNSTLAFSAGQVSFLDLKMSTAGAKVLKFTKPNTTPFGGSAELTVNSNSFTAIIGAPAKLGFVTQTTGGTAGVVWGTQPVVEIQDTAGNRVTTAPGTVSIALTGGTGPLLGGTTAVASSGVATFTNLKINVSGANKVIRASMGTLATVSSGTFDVAHAMASQLAFVTAPGAGSISTNLSPQPVVEVRDAFNNRVTTGPDATGYVTASLQAGSGTLTGTTLLAASSGRVTYTNLRINQTGAKTLRFTKDDNSGFTGGTGVLTLEANVNINPGPVSTLAVVVAPTGAVAGQAFTTQPQIEMRDASGNRATTSVGTISVSLQSGTGAILGTASAVASSGLATFTNLQMNISGHKVLRFARGGTVVDAASFRVKPGIATQMEVTTEPAGAIVEQAFTTQPVLTLKDAYDNLVDEGADASANVTASLVTGTPSLSGQLTATASAGVVTYTNLAATSVGAKTIRFTKADLSGSGGASALTQNSGSFVVQPGAGVDLIFTAQPSGGTAGLAWTMQPRLEIRDAYGNVATGESAVVDLALTTGSGTLGGVASVTAVSGVATFSGLHVDAMGTGKILTATGAGLNAVSSNAFNIVAGAPIAASDIAISGGPKWSNGTDTYTVSVTLRDAYGNPVAGKSVALASDRGGLDTILTTPSTSGVGGDVSFTVSSLTAGTSSLTASVSSPAVTITPSVTGVFDDFKVSAAQSSWTQDRVSLAADGAALLTFSGVLKNAAGTPLPQKSLGLSSSRGGSDVITATNGGTTDGSGAYSFTVKSASPGLSRLTLGVSADAVNVTTNGRAQFLARTPYSEYVPALASADGLKMIPGTNTSPQVNSWIDVAPGGAADLALLGFAYNTTSSGWMGDGNTTISNGTTGPYRLTFDGSGDGANGGTSFNSLSSLGYELWARPSAVTAGRTLIGNASGANGLSVKIASDGSGRWEVRTGTSSIYNEVVAADSPTNYYRMNESSGTTVTPTIGSATGTYTASGVTYGRAGALASSDKAVEFNGSSGWADFGLTNDIADEFTAEAWIYLPSTAGLSTSRAIMAKATGSAGYRVEVTAGAQVAFSAYIGSGWKTATGATVLSPGQYYHIAVVKKNVQCSTALNYGLFVYVNGVEDGCVDYSSFSPSYTAAASANFRVGDHEAYADRRFPGRIDEVATYGAALSDARILAHYSARSLAHCYSSAAITTGKWAHLIASFENSTQNLRLQLDGAEVCNLATSGVTLNGGSAALGVGARINAGAVSGGTEWAGSIGDLRIYDHGINATEAATNHGAQSSRYPD